MNFPELSSQIQDLLALHVYPELSSTIGFLRSRSCWAYGKFASFPFSNKEHQQQALEKICLLLLDPSLPVKYEAALTIPKILIWDISKTRIKGEISNLLKIYLNLINEIDSEEIIEALENIVENFTVEVLPFVVELVEQLCLTFKKLASREIADDNGDSAMAAVSSLNTIQKLIETVGNNQNELYKISLGLFDVLEHCLSKNGFEYMEEALSILNLIVYNADSNSLSHLYGLSKVILLSLDPSDPYGLEKTSTMFSVLANFISKYPSLVVNDIENIIKFLIVLSNDNNKLKILACQLFSVLFESLRSSLANYFIPILDTVYAIFKNSTSDKVKNIACQAVYAGIWADTEKFSVIIENSGILSEILQYSLSHLSYYKDSISRIQVVVGLSSLFPLIPNFFKNVEFGLLKEALKTVVQFIDTLDKDFEESDEEIDPNSNEFDDKCQELYKKIKEKIEENDDDEKDFFENDSDEYFDSLFEKIDYKGFFKEMLAKTLPNVVNLLTESIEFEQKAILNRLINN